MRTERLLNADKKHRRDKTCLTFIALVDGSLGWKKWKAMLGTIRLYIQADAIGIIIIRSDPRRKWKNILVPINTPIDSGFSNLTIHSQGKD